MKSAPTARAQRRAAWQQQFRRQPATVHLRIGELALTGFAKGSERRIAASFERELHSQLTHQLPPTWEKSSSTETLNARMRVRSARDPIAIGEHLAAAVLSASQGKRR